MSRRQRYTRNLGRALTAPTSMQPEVVVVRFEHERELYGLFSYVSVAQENLPGAERRELAE